MTKDSDISNTAIETSADEQQRIERDSQLLARRSVQIQRGAARAAVLGVNDGLVSVLCLILAVAAAGQPASNILIAGLGGMIAGAFSMAAGEWVSVASQVDLFKGVLADLKRLVVEDKILLTKQLKEDFEKSGLDTKTADVASREIARNDEHLTEEYARNVMGLNPDELGSPWLAAISSFLLFTVGALVPLFPWFFTEGLSASLMSIAFTAVGALIVGGYVSVSSDIGLFKGAARQLFIIIFASSVTYGVGHLFGVVVG